MKDELERIKKGDAFPVEKIGKLMVKLDEGKQLAVNPNYVPMNECHTVEVGETDQKADLFIIRASVKYSFYVRNESSRSKTVTGYAVHDMARQAYLLPRGVRYRDVEGSDGTIYKEIEAFEVPETEYYTYLPATLCQKIKRSPCRLPAIFWKANMCMKVKGERTRRRTIR